MEPKEQKLPPKTSEAKFVFTIFAILILIILFLAFIYLITGGDPITAGMWLA